ncbi:hypothetical protein QYE76_015051 [Lolium multiflorum]|uniref:Uncharacterized protein n=1 Tax=Lolium multiflorum TaxID=4521 RepID=A0AAD8U7C7_LOLMU|nr:hypothetical protein QYE76_015051 [Lolium multiflorum]
MEKRKRKEDEEEGQVAAAAGPWASVPSDLLPEILSRCPTGRFAGSSVCPGLCSRPRAPSGRGLPRRSPASSAAPSATAARASTSSTSPDGAGRALVDPSLRFVRGYGYQEVTPLHCCGGILICYCWRVDMQETEQVVCNPATEEIWAVLTAPCNELMKNLNNTRLCFDPAIPSRFTVFVFMHDRTGIISVEVYSSETGQWTSMKSEWSPKTLSGSGGVFSPGAGPAAADDRWGPGDDVAATLANHPRTHTRCSTPCTDGDHCGPAWRARANERVPGSLRGRVRLVSSARTRGWRRRFQEVAGASPAAGSCGGAFRLRGEEKQNGGKKEKGDVQKVCELNVQTRWPERNQRRRNGRKTAAAGGDGVVDFVAVEPSRLDSSHQEEEDVKRKLLVTLVRRGATETGGAMARRRWRSRWLAERKKKRGKEVAARGREKVGARVLQGTEVRLKGEGSRCGVVGEEDHCILTHTA